MQQLQYSKFYARDACAQARGCDFKQLFRSSSVVMLHQVWGATPNYQW
jgi:hypothetical protein